MIKIYGFKYTTRIKVNRFGKWVSSKKIIKNKKLRIIKKTLCLQSF